MDTTTQLKKRLLQNDSTLTDLIVAPFNEAFYSPQSLAGWKRLGTLLGKTTVLQNSQSHSLGIELFPAVHNSTH